MTPAPHDRPTRPRPTRPVGTAPRPAPSRQGSAPAQRAHRRARRGASAVLVCAALAVTGAAAGSAAGPQAGSTAATTSAEDGAVLYRAPVLRTLDVQRPFEAPPQPWAAGHRGVDLAARDGEAVVAPAAGVVTFAGTVVDRGVLTITHPDGRRSSVEPVRPVAAVGTAVAAGDVVAVVTGPAHCPPLTCLHWGVREGKTYVDPLTLLPGAGPVVLLPARDR
ncbi:peptidoglycan DD-metalloendopeptidase family protein [Cellulomonas sp. SLBN-39]|uniref:peptidoglycan DD-metalloendopeptidase family protein n=1 Tax=Cellulomonas sp. SLBN-39 TaxID=2768446 RepID=UPI0011526867|nr:peptidoglycan DD-metalloendopeptidase family protein [Cellulomonas sp. SLBN-39]TQL04549.1 peptidase M23-like protein [Cellulomonas sp. SLBN-39]